MNAFRTRSTAVIVLSIVLLGAGCGGDSIRFLGEKVKEPGPFLASVEQKWRADLTKERVNLHKEARCYFSRAEEAEEIDGLAFCGPARHYAEKSSSGSGDQSGTGTPFEAPGDGVWDTYALKGQPIEGGYQLADTGRQATGVDVPPGVSLFRLDDKTPPVDGNKLTAPPPPPAASGFITVVHEDPDIAHTANHPAVDLEAPIYNYRVQALGTTDTIETTEGTRTAAKGEELLVTEVSASPGRWEEDYREETFPEEDVVNADPVFSIGTPTERKGLDLAASSDGGTDYVITSVPKGDKSTVLTVSVAGRSQTVNVITGQTDAAPTTSTVTINQQYSTTSVSIPEKDGWKFEASHANTFTNAWLTPFHPQKGWAPQGKTWLILETDGAMFTWDQLDFGITPDFAASTIAQAKGTTYRNVGKARPSVSMEAGKTGWPVFEVDPSLRSFKVTYQPTWRYETNQSLWGISGTAKFKPMSFDVTFPE